MVEPFKISFVFFYLISVDRETQSHEDTEGQAHLANTLSYFENAFIHLRTKSGGHKDKVIHYEGKICQAQHSQQTIKNAFHCSRIKSFLHRQVTNIVTFLKELKGSRD